MTSPTVFEQDGELIVVRKAEGMLLLMSSGSRQSFESWEESAGEEAFEEACESRTVLPSASRRWQ